MNDARPPPQQREESDAVAVWARRTGRFLGYLALFLMALYLLVTYGPS